jgi:hypothetical protein
LLQCLRVIGCKEIRIETEGHRRAK